MMSSLLPALMLLLGPLRAHAASSDLSQLPSVRGVPIREQLAPRPRKEREECFASAAFSCANGDGMSYHIVAKEPFCLTRADLAADAESLCREVGGRAVKLVLTPAGPEATLKPSPSPSPAPRPGR